uniref:Uncharacterized protein n=1 Tax=Nothobranchius korthausae TaxID=1143690 RepID=A0A1A8HN27_9TELE
MNRDEGVCTLDRSWDTVVVRRARPRINGDGSEATTISDALKKATVVAETCQQDGKNKSITLCSERNQIMEARQIENLLEKGFVCKGYSRIVKGE